MGIRTWLKRRKQLPGESDSDSSEDITGTGINLNNVLEQSEKDERRTKRAQRFSISKPKDDDGGYTSRDGAHTNRLTTSRSSKPSLSNRGGEKSVGFSNHTEIVTIGGDTPGVMIHVEQHQNGKFTTRREQAVIHEPVLAPGSSTDVPNGGRKSALKSARLNEDEMQELRALVESNAKAGILKGSKCSSNPASEVDDLSRPSEGTAVGGGSFTLRLRDNDDSEGTLDDATLYQNTIMTARNLRKFNLYDDAKTSALNDDEGRTSSNDINSNSKKKRSVHPTDLSSIDDISSHDSDILDVLKKTRKQSVQYNKRSASASSKSKSNKTPVPVPVREKSLSSISDLSFSSISSLCDKEDKQGERGRPKSSLPVIPPLWTEGNQERALIPVTESTAICKTTKRDRNKSVPKQSGVTGTGTKDKEKNKDPVGKESKNEKKSKTGKKDKDKEKLKEKATKNSSKPRSLPVSTVTDDESAKSASRHGDKSAKSINSGSSRHTQLSMPDPLAQIQLDVMGLSSLSSLSSLGNVPNMSQNVPNMSQNVPKTPSRTPKLGGKRVNGGSDGGVLSQNGPKNGLKYPIYPPPTPPTTSATPLRSGTQKSKSKNINISIISSIEYGEEICIPNPYKKKDVNRGDGVDNGRLKVAPVTTPLPFKGAIKKKKRPRLESGVSVDVDFGGRTTKDGGLKRGVSVDSALSSTNLTARIMALRSKPPPGGRFKG